MNNIKSIKIISSLEKVYCNDSIPSKSLEYISLLKNERKSFQIVIESKEETFASNIIETDLKNYKIYKVVDIKSDLPMTKTGADDYYKFSDNGYYPDLLIPITKELELSKGKNIFWVEIDAENNGIGLHNIKFCIEELYAEINIEIIDADLDFSDFVYTNWFHTDCLMSYYGFDAFSKEYWRVTENFLKTASEHGMNCVLTPIFTPPLDTAVGSERPTVQLIDIEYNKGEYSFNFDKLTQWIDMAHRCNIEYFELAHFYTQWGAKYAPKIMATVDGEYKQIFGWDTKSTSKEYKTFLLALSIKLNEFFENNNLKDKVFIHVSDEPNFSVISTYAKASKYIHKLFKGYKIIDALSDYWFYKLKIISNPIPANNHIDKFLGNIDNLWTYYCSAQKNKNVSNRFFCNSSLRNRVIGYQMYKFNIKGFLHWGYNFYYTQLSRELINPFEVTDAGKSFPSGDSFVVYPGENGMPLESIRLKVFYDALQDMAALRTLEKSTDKTTCLNIIENNGEFNLTFSEYPHNDEWLLSSREKINELIKKQNR